MAGKDLLKELSSATGLPQEPVMKELTDLVTKANVSPEEIDIDTLREILAEYLQQVILESKEQYSK
jgi:hypothetical protein